MSTATLFIAHGSREKGSNDAFLTLVEALRQSQKPPVFGAFLELAEPSIPQAIENCVKIGATEIDVIPLMFFEGRHVKEDIPRFLKEGQSRHPRLVIRNQGALASHPLFLEFLKQVTKK